MKKSGVVLALLVWVSVLVPLSTPAVFAEEIGELEFDVEVTGHKFTRRGSDWNEECTLNFASNNVTCVRDWFSFAVNVLDGSSYTPFEEFYELEWDVVNSSFVLFHEREVALYEEAEVWDDFLNETVITQELSGYETVRDVYQRLPVTTSEPVNLSPIIKPFPGGFEFGVEGNANGPMSVSFAPSFVDGVRVVNGLKRISANGSVFSAEDMRKNGEVRVTGKSFSVVVEGPFKIDPTFTFDFNEVKNDSYVNESATATNYGSGTDLALTNSTDAGITGNSWVLIEVNFSDILLGTVSSFDEANITLRNRLHFTNGDAELHHITEGWDEDDVTWNNQPTYNTTAESTTSMTEAENYTWNFTQALSDSFFEGNNSVSFFIMPPAGGSGAEAFFSASELETAVYSPRGVIRYTVNVAPDIFPEPFDTDIFYDDVFNVSGGWDDVDGNVNNFTIILQSPTTNYTYPTNFVLIDDYENASAFQNVSGDALVGVLEGTTKQEGTYSMNLSVDIDIDGVSRWNVHFEESPKNLSRVTGVTCATPTRGELAVWHYIADPDNLINQFNAVAYVFGNITHRLTYNAGKSNFTAGWNLIKVDMSEPHGVSGDGVCWDNITMQIYFFGNSNTADFDNYLDYMVAYDSTDLYWNGTGYFEVGHQFNETGDWIYFLDVHDEFSNNITSETFEVFDFLNVSTEAQFFPEETNTYGINVTFQINTTEITNITTVGLEWNGTTFTNTALLNQVTHATGIENYTWGFAQFPAPLVASNDTNATFNWTYTIDYTTRLDDTRSTSDEEQSVQHAYTVDNVFASPDEIIGGLNTTFIGNTTNNTINATRTFTFEWNGTNFSSTTILDGSKINYSREISTSILGNDTQVINVTGWLNLTHNGTTQWRFQTNDTTLSQMNVTNCSAGGETDRIFVHLDEINESSLPGTVELTAFVTLGNGTQVQFSFNVTNNATAFMCVQPASANLTSDRIELIYYLTGYSVRSYYLRNVTIDNSSTTINLYSLNNASETSSGITIKVQNNTGTFENGFILKFNRYYWDEGIYKTSAMVETDDVGESFTYLQLNNGWYEVLAEDANGDFVQRFDKRIFDSVEATFIINYEDLVKFWTYNQVAAVCTFNASGADTLRVTVTDTTGEMGTAFLQVWSLGVLGETNVCDLSGTGTAVVLACPFTDTTLQHFYRLYAQFSGTEFDIPCAEFPTTFIDPTTKTNPFGDQGLIATILFVITMFFAGTANPILSIAMLIAALGISMLIGINIFDVNILFAVFGIGILIIIKFLRSRFNG